MARWTGQASTLAILDAAAEWRERCLLADGSIFTDRRAWGAETVADLRARLAAPVPDGIAGFDSHLAHQLRDAPVATRIVAAEALWLLLLFLRGNYAPATKRAKILTALEAARVQPSRDSLLADEVLDGIANGGPGFAIGIGKQWAFLVDTLARWKATPAPEREAIMADRDGWRFAEWVDRNPDAEKRAMRHALVYLLFPDSFERIVSLKHKWAFFRRFRDRLPTGGADPESLCDLDRVLLQIRRGLEAEYGTTALDFYRPPLAVAPAESDTAGPTAEPLAEAAAAPSAPALFVEPEELAEIDALLAQKRNIIFHGPPGTGKTLVARHVAQQWAGDPARITTMQFHQSVGYEDFIIGWRASATGFLLQDGRFKRFCAEAANAPDRPHVFVIDEINRGNLSRIFGETLMLIEADKRGPAHAVTLAANGETFCVPENVYLIGMMNTADRSLAVVDYALRRRFAFFAMPPRFDSPRFEATLQQNGVPEALIRRICDRLPKLNAMIAGDTATLGPGFAIGHSFFCTPPGDDPEVWYERIVERELRPLLEEYWFDRPDKVKDAIAALLKD